MRPTKTSSRPVQSLGSGYRPWAGSSTTTMPGNAPSTRRASATERGRSVSTTMVSLWQFATGTRTQVAVTGRSGSPMILRVSYTIFSSSLV